jgi:hypothetical protein
VRSARHEGNEGAQASQLWDASHGRDKSSLSIFKESLASRSDNNKEGLTMH